VLQFTIQPLRAIGNTHHGFQQLQQTRMPKSSLISSLSIVITPFIKRILSLPKAFGKIAALAVLPTVTATMSVLKVAPPVMPTRGVSGPILMHLFPTVASQASPEESPIQMPHRRSYLIFRSFASSASYVVEMACLWRNHLLSYIETMSFLQPTPFIASYA